MRTRSFKSSGAPVIGDHRSVLLHEAIAQLDIQPNETVVDATLGAGGHAKELLKRLGGTGKLIGFDADREAIARLRQTLSGDAVHLIHANFRTMQSELSQLGIGTVSKVLFDLGWGTHQFGTGRGFSFLSDEPLSLAYDESQSLQASTIVNEWAEESIADVLYGWGEERYARRIARRIVEARADKPIATAKELGELVKQAVPPAYRYGKTHPATKTFQALRIAVNDELGALENGLNAAWALLESKGRIAVITFHSIEDRQVKRMFQAWEKDSLAVRITKKPITAGEQELAANPRARSAKLRVIEKI